jgi:hypothetical protein
MLPRCARWCSSSVRARSCLEVPLLRQAHQRVGGAFDFETVHTAVDDGDIDARLGMRKAEFVDDERVVAAVKGA